MRRRVAGAMEALLRAAEQLGISRKNFYKWLRRAKEAGMV